MGHKRILGKTTDFITGREITDTDDERYRQKLARFLVEEKGYAKEEVLVKPKIEMIIDDRKVRSMIDLVVSVGGRNLLAIRYGPGSLVTRERPAIAAARIIGDYQVPVTVVTNGEDAEIIDTVSGKVLGSGLDSIPHREDAVRRLGKTEFHSLTSSQRKAEERILSAYDWLEHSLECDADWCETDEAE